MGNTCGINRKKALNVHKRVNMDSKSRTKRSMSYTKNSNFKFMLNDEDLLISPSSIRTDEKSIVTHSSTKNNCNWDPNKFTFDNLDESPLDLWVRQLTNNSCLDDSDEDINITREQSDAENKPHLYRPDTMSRWYTDDMDEKQQDMTQQLHHLALITEVNTPKKDIVDGNIDDDCSRSIRSKSKLIITLSQEYDSDVMEIEENQMKKHLLYLRNNHSKSSVNNGEVYNEMIDYK